MRFFSIFYNQKKYCFKNKMKKIILTLLFTSLSLTILADSWNVSNVFEKKDIERGAKAIDKNNNVIEIQSILVPHKLISGEYKIIVSEVSPTLLKVEGTNLFLEMEGTKLLYGPCSLLKPKAEVILQIGWPTNKIVYKNALESFNYEKDRSFHLKTQVL